MFGNQRPAAPWSFNNWWGQYGTYGDLPNVAGSRLQLPRDVQAGDIAWVVDAGALYVCSDPTQGAAVWDSLSLAGLVGCTLSCSAPVSNFTPTGPTIGDYFVGVDNELLSLGGGGVVMVDGTLDAPSGTEVGSQLNITVNKAAGDYIAERTNVVETAAPGTANKLREWVLNGVTPKVSLMSSGAVIAHNPGTDAAPALQVDRGSGGAVGITNPADNQLGLVANGAKLIVDNDGAIPSLRPDVTGTWDLGKNGLVYRRAHIQTLVDPIIAASADPVNRAVSMVLSSLTAARTITMPDTNVDLQYARAASTTVSGGVEIATQAEVDAGTDTTRSITPETLRNTTIAPIVSTSTIGMQIGDSDAVINGGSVAGPVDGWMIIIDPSTTPATVQVDVSTAKPGSMVGFIVANANITLHFLPKGGSGVTVQPGNNFTAFSTNVWGAWLVLYWATTTYAFLGGDRDLA